MHVPRIMLNQNTISDMITEKTSAYCHGVDVCVRRLLGLQFGHNRILTSVYGPGSTGDYS